MGHSPHLFNGIPERHRTAARGAARPRSDAGLLVAWPLQISPAMNAEYIGWQRLTPDTITDLPEEGAVFEVANLVRNVQLIGRAEGNLRMRLGTLLREHTVLPATPGGYFFRYETAANEDEALLARLAAYRATHLGMVPIGNQDQPRTLRVASRRAA
jgi:hypothetical protein